MTTFSHDFFQLLSAVPGESSQVAVVKMSALWPFADPFFEGNSGMQFVSLVQCRGLHLYGPSALSKLYTGSEDVEWAVTAVRTDEHASFRQEAQSGTK